jgi:hypothetical protein
MAYLYVGIYSSQSLSLIPYILPSILIGVPIGGFLIRRIRHETFRRVCMSFDAWVVAFGISTLLQQLGFVPGMSAYSVLVAVIVIDAWLMYRFFKDLPPAEASTGAEATPRVQ